MIYSTEYQHYFSTVYIPTIDAHIKKCVQYLLDFLDHIVVGIHHLSDLITLCPQHQRV